MVVGAFNVESASLSHDWRPLSRPPLIPTENEIILKVWLSKDPRYLAMWSLMQYIIKGLKSFDSRQHITLKYYVGSSLTVVPPPEYWSRPRLKIKNSLEIPGSTQDLAGYKRCRQESGPGHFPLWLQSFEARWAGQDGAVVMHWSSALLGCSEATQQ